MRCSILGPVTRPMAMLLLVAGVAGAGAVRAASAEAVDAGLLDAIRAVDEAGVRAALDRGADVTAAEPDGTTPLHWGVHADDAGIVELLLAAGADGAATNRYGVAPIALACVNGNAAIVRLLLDAGVDPNTTLAEGRRR